MVKLQSRAPPTFDKKDIKPLMGINYPLIQALIANQLLIFGAASVLALLFTLFNRNAGDAILQGGLLNWSDNPFSPMAYNNLFLTQDRVIEGLLGALPSIALGSAVDRSDDRKFANANFSTIYMVMTLFGRRAMPVSSSPANSSANCLCIN